MKKLPDLVWVKWVDSHAQSRWEDRKETMRFAKKTPCTCWTSGFFVHENSKFLSIGLNTAKTGSWDSVMKIPKVAILKRHNLAGPKLVKGKKK